MNVLNMFEVEEQTNEKRVLKFYLIDGHHHIGEDTDNHKNLTINGSFDFFRAIWSLLNSKYEEYENNKEYPTYFKPRFKIKNIFPPAPLDFLKSNPIHANSWIIDQFIAFPFHDKFREKPRNDGKIVQYHNSNTRLANIISSNDSGCRLIGYCRLNPTDGNLALEELDYSILKMGLKGIKLHPISDEWNEKNYFEENSLWVKEILRRAIKYNIPVIFDCRFVNTLKWIYNIVNILQEEYQDNRFDDNYIYDHLKVIVAHIGFLMQNDDLLYEVLSHPCIYGDLTGLFSSRTKDLIENLYEKVKCPYQDLPSMGKKYYWSTKIFVGSDFNYFEAFHIVDQLLYFLSEDFYNLIEGNLSVLQNIFSENILNLIPNDIPARSKNLSKITKNNVFSVNLDQQQYNKFIDSVFSYIRNDTSDQNPNFFRIDQDINFNSFLQSQSFYSRNFSSQISGLTKQNNFYFTWNDYAFIISGIILNLMDRYVIYFFNNKELEDPSFELLKNSATQIILGELPPEELNKEIEIKTAEIFEKLKINIREN